MERFDGTGLRLAAHVPFGGSLSYRRQTTDVSGVLVSGQYFVALGVTPTLGRLLGPEDDRAPGAHPQVVLSYDYWRTRFNADPNVVNDRLVLNGEPMTIVGVAPQGFTGMTIPERPQIYMPLAMAAQAIRDPGWNGMTARNNHWLYVFARLDSGMSREQAESRVNGPFAALIKDVEYPALRTGMGDRDRRQFQERRLFLSDGSRGQARNRLEVRNVLLLMFAVTGLVLAIACANVANLLLTRVLDRSAETSVRLSLGASPNRVTRLFLTEAALLGVIGSVVALAVTRITLDGLIAMLPNDGDAASFGIDVTVFAFAVGLGLATSLLFGLFPSIHGVRRAAAAGLQSNASRVSHSKAANRFRAVMATAQIALATALLAVAGLFIVSLINIAREDLGIRREGLVTFGLSAYQNGYPPARARDLFEQVESRLRAIPGVVSVTATTVPILADSSWGNNVTIEGIELTEDSNMNASTARTSVDYFRTLGIPLLAGREFTSADADSSAKVAIVNQAFVRKFKLEPRVIGRRMALGAGGNRPLDIEIVGLVGDAKYDEVREPAPPQFVMPYRQVDTGALTFYVRSASPDTRPLLGMIQSVVAQLDANLPIGDFATMEDQIRGDTSRDRMLSLLASAFAVVAVLLAAIGLYAMLAYGVAQRLREIGIRVALGAQPRDVRRLVLAQVGRIGVSGAVIGGVLGLGIGRLAQAALFGVQGDNPSIIASAALVAMAVAFSAAVLPMRRASRVQPVEVLKAE